MANHAIDLKFVEWRVNATEMRQIIDPFLRPIMVIMMQDQAEMHNHFAQTPFPFTKIILYKPLAEDAWELAGSCPICRLRLIVTVQKLQQKQRETTLIIKLRCSFIQIDVFLICFNQ